MERKIRTVPIIRTVKEEVKRPRIKTVSPRAIRTFNRGEERFIPRQPIEELEGFENVRITPYDNEVSPDFKTLGELIKLLR